MKFDKLDILLQLHSQKWCPAYHFIIYWFELAVIPAGSLDNWYANVKEEIKIQQEEPVWMSEDKVRYASICFAYSVVLTSDPGNKFPVVLSYFWRLFKREASEALWLRKEKKACYFKSNCPVPANCLFCWLPFNLRLFLWGIFVCWAIVVFVFSLRTSLTLSSVCPAVTLSPMTMIPRWTHQLSVHPSPPSMLTMITWF